MNTTADDHVERVAARIAADDLAVIAELKGWTGNSELLGTLAEACLIRLVRRIAAPLRVSTGSVIDFPPETPLPQVDVVIWAPYPAPPIFEVDNFAIVPRSSAFGALEIKRSNYPGVNNDRWFDPDRWRSRLLDPEPGIPNLPAAAMGVICLVTARLSAALQRQIDAGSVVAIFDARGATPAVRARDVARLINWLSYVRWRCFWRMSNLPPGLIIPAARGADERTAPA